MRYILRRNLWIFLLCILAITVLAGLIDWPSGPNIFGREIKVHEGLDLQGGTHLVYELDTSKYGGKDVNSATQAVINVIDKRINALGVSEPLIQSSKMGDKSTIIVELPGVSDVNEAINLIGKTAQLKFQEQEPPKEENQAQVIGGESGFKDTALTGANLKRAEVQFDQTSGEPQVSLQFDEEGTKLFAEITKKNLQKPVAISLDNEIISAPTVQSTIENGQAVITGKFSVEEAKKLTIQLNAGALPVPISLVEQRNVGASLGDESVKKSLVAGLIGLIMIGLFMISYYKIPGLLAVIALFIYTLITLAIFKLIPITLSLAGITGFILSVGMAVDANILIFERTKEEEALGKSTGAALEEGFRRAWSSIRDSNFASLITAAILYYGTSGIVRGFAVTLAIGILVSLFTSIVVSRTFLRLFVGTRFEKYLTIK